MENLIKKLSIFYEDAENGKCLTPYVRVINGNARILELLQNNKNYQSKIAEYYGKSIVTREENTEVLKILIEKLYKESGVDFEDENQRNKRKANGNGGYTGKKWTLYNDMPKYFRFNGTETEYSEAANRDSRSMSLVTAIDVLSALNKCCDFFYDDSFYANKNEKEKSKKDFEEFLENYKKIIRVFVRSRAIPFYARSLEDICAVYCIFHCKTVKTYEGLLGGFNKKIKEAQQDAAKPIDDTPTIRENIMNFIFIQDDKSFEKKMNEIIEENPWNFQVVRYKEVIDNCLKYFSDEGLIDNGFIATLHSELFDEKEEHIVRVFSADTRKNLLSKVLKIEVGGKAKDSKKKNSNGINRDLDENHVFYEITLQNNKMSPQESVVGFLRALVIMYYYQELDKSTLSANDTIKRLNRKLESLLLTPIVYDKSFAVKWFEFDWGFGRLVEEELTN